MHPHSPELPDGVRKYIEAAHANSLDAMIDHYDIDMSGKFRNQQTWLMSRKSVNDLVVGAEYLEQEIQNLLMFDL